MKFHYEMVDLQGSENEDYRSLAGIQVEIKPTPKHRRLTAFVFPDMGLCCGSTQTLDDIEATKPLTVASLRDSKTFSSIISSTKDGIELSISSRTSISISQLPPVLTCLLDQISYSPEFHSFLRPIALPPRPTWKPKKIFAGRPKPPVKKRDPSTRASTPVAGYFLDTLFKRRKDTLSNFSAIIVQEPVIVTIM